MSKVRDTDWRTPITQELIVSTALEVEVSTKFYSLDQVTKLLKSISALNKIIGSNVPLLPLRNMFLVLIFGTSDMERFSNVRLGSTFRRKSAIVPRMLSEFLLTALFLNRIPVIDLESLGIDNFDKLNDPKVDSIFKNALERIIKCDRTLILIRHYTNLGPIHLDRFIKYLRDTDGILEVKFKLPDGNMISRNYDFKSLFDGSLEACIASLQNHSKAEWSLRRAYKSGSGSAAAASAAPTSPPSVRQIIVPSGTTTDVQGIEITEFYRPRSNLHTQVQTLRFDEDRSGVAAILAAMGNPQVQNPTVEPAPKRYRAGTEI